MEFFGDILEGARATAPTDKPRKSLGVKRVVGEEIQMFASHLAAAWAAQTSNIELQVNSRVAAGKVARSKRTAVVPTRVCSTTFLADRLFERRTSVMTRAFESPKTPRTDADGRKPANRYASRRRLRLRLRKVAIAKSCQFPQQCQTAETRIQKGVQTIS